MCAAALSLVVMLLLLRADCWRRRRRQSLNVLIDARWVAKVPLARALGAPAASVLVV